MEVADPGIRIYRVRGQRVMLDADLATLYDVTTKRLNEQVRRNAARFPRDFGFQLTRDECLNLKSQFATSSWGGRRTVPWVFTEHGAVMLASVLNSPVAVDASVKVVRVFIRMREELMAHRGRVLRVDELEGRYDGQFKAVFDAIRGLMDPPVPRRPRIGFHVRPRKSSPESRARRA